MIGVPLRVVSFPRSGTHLAAATFWLNFEMPSLNWPAEAPPKRFSIGGQRRDNIPWGLLAQKAHAHFETLEWGQDRLVYIMRHPFDVLRSHWWMDHPGERDAAAALTNRRIDGYRKHVNGYVDGGAYIVRYEQLVADPNVIVQGVAQRYDLDPIWSPALRVPVKVGWDGERGPTSGAPELSDDLKRRIAERLGDDFHGYDLRIPDAQ